MRELCERDLCCQWWGGLKAYFLGEKRGAKYFKERVWLQLIKGKEKEIEKGMKVVLLPKEYPNLVFKIQKLEDKHGESCPMLEIMPPFLAIEKAIYLLSTAIQSKRSYKEVVPEFSQLVLVYKGNKYFLQVCKRVNGADLSGTSRASNTAMEDVLKDNKSFFYLFILSLLVNFQDGHHENYIDDATNKDLYCIDADNAFGDIYSRKHVDSGGEKYIRHYSNIKDMLYFLPRTNEEIDLDHIRGFLQQSPRYILLRWVNMLKDQDVCYANQTKVLSQATKDILQVPLKLKPGEFNRVLYRLVKINKILMDVLDKRSSLTYLELFHQVHPLLARYYSKVLDQAGSSLSAIQSFYASNSSNYVASSIEDTLDMTPAEVTKALKEQEKGWQEMKGGDAFIRQRSSGLKDQFRSIPLSLAEVIEKPKVSDSVDKLAAVFLLPLMRIANKLIDRSACAMTIALCRDLVVRINNCKEKRARPSSVISFIQERYRGASMEVRHEFVKIIENYHQLLSTKSVADVSQLSELRLPLSKKTVNTLSGVSESGTSPKRAA